MKRAKAEGFDGYPTQMDSFLMHESAQEDGFDCGNWDWFWRTKQVRGKVKGQAQFIAEVRIAADFDVFLNYNPFQL